MKHWNRSGKFFKGVIIYIAAFLAVMCVALTAFWFYMADYQNNLPETVLKEYISSFDTKRLADKLSNSDSSIEFNEYESWQSIINNLCGNSLIDFVYSKNSRSTSLAPIYDISFGDIKVFSVSLTDSGKKSAFGFTEWDIASLGVCESFAKLEKVDLNISLPENIDCTINGKKPTESDYVKKEAYRSVYPFENDTSSLPQMKVYRISGFYTLPNIVPDADEITDYTVSFTKKETDKNEISAVIDFSENCSRRHSITVTAPSNATIKINGVKIGDEYKEDAEQSDKYYEYADSEFNAVFKGTKGTDSSLPVRTVYRIDGLLTYGKCTAEIRGTEIECVDRDSDKTKDELYIFEYPDELLYSCEIQAPTEYDVYVNGIKLGKDNISQEECVTDIIREFAEYVESPLTVTSYTVEKLYNKPTVKIMSRDSEKEMGYTQTDNDCIVAEIQKSPELRDAREEIVCDTVIKYIEYSVAGFSDVDMSKYYTILNQTLQNSPAYDMVVSSRFSFAQNIPCRIDNVDITTYDYYKWGENCFSCYVDFTIDMYNFAKVHDEIKGVNMFFVMYNDEWKLVKMLYT